MHIVIMAEEYLEKYSFLFQLTTVGTVIRRITAVDHDLSINGVVTYAMEQLSPSGQPTFTMNQFTGDLTLARSLDLQTTYQLRITATVSVVV